MPTSSPPKRRLNGLYIIGSILAIAFIWGYQTDVPAVYCPENAADLPSVVMLGTSWCPYCMQARRLFTKHHVIYCEYDIERSKQGARLFEELGGREIPLILINNQKISGFLESRVLGFLNQHNLIPTGDDNHVNPH